MACPPSSTSRRTTRGLRRAGSTKSLASPLSVLVVDEKLRVTCPDCIIRELAPEMLALLREFRSAFEPGEYIEDGQLDDLAVRTRALLSRLPKEGE